MWRGKWQIAPEKFLTEEEKRKLLETCEAQAELDKKRGRKTWIRRWLLIDLLFFSGLRVSEIVHLKIKDLSLSKGKNKIFVRRGKGGKAGYVAIDSELARHIKEFLKWKELAGEKTGPEAFLLACGKDSRPYTKMALQKAFKKAFRVAGLPSHYSIHCARHTYATHLLKETGNLRLVQKQLRHSSPSVTAVYAAVIEEGLTEGVEKLRAASKSLRT